MLDENLFAGVNSHVNYPSHGHGWQIICCFIEARATISVGRGNSR